MIKTLLCCSPVVLMLMVFPFVQAEEKPAAAANRTVADIAMSCDAKTTYARMLFPGGRKKALTMSFDDGRIHDRRLVRLFNEHGIRGTFNLVSGTLGKEGYVTREEIKTLYAGHEVAAHTVTHPPLPKQTDETITREVMENRKDLERLVGYPVRGLAYPGGEADQRVADFLPKLGIAYARLVGSTTWMATPDKSPTLWACTGHHGDCAKQGERLLAWPTYPALLSIWGHSYEFEETNNWKLIEDFCQKMGGRQDIWYATNIEVFDYMAAARRLIVAADGSFIYNPSAIPVWIEMTGRTIQLKPSVVTQVAGGREPAGSRENPAYRAWADFKPGATVVLSTVSMQGEAKQADVETTSRLVEVHADRVIIENTGSMEAGDSRVKLPAEREEILAKIASDKLPPGKVVDESEETIEVGGRGVRVYRTRRVDERGAVRTESTSWISRDIPGGVAREVIEVKGKQTTVTRTDVLRWEAAR